MSDRLEEAAEQFFAPTLKKLKLTVEQIEKQSLTELQASLDTVNEAISYPASFGVMRVMLTADVGVVITKAKSEAHMEVGILPVLLERKALILERINLIRPTEQIRDFRQEVTEKVRDPQIREQLLKVLDEHAIMQQELSSKIEKEAASASSALAEETINLRNALAVAKIEGRLEIIEKLTEKLDGEKVTKFDSATITLAILAAIGGLTGAVIGLIRWVTG
ncbi:hypothetical protein AB0H92_07150 [Streptomyces phaeochromogenes]|uniref:hypothetical protein n=1 Tax=Streptomyces phaeochromogenes TaxID=1923 RepID=UPI0033C1D46E